MFRTCKKSAKISIPLKGQLAAATQAVVQWCGVHVQWRICASLVAKAPRRRHAIALPPQSVFAATEAGDYYSRRTSLAKKVLRLSFAWQNSAFEVRSSDSSQNLAPLLQSHTQGQLAAARTTKRSSQARRSSPTRFYGHRHQRNCNKWLLLLLLCFAKAAAAKKNSRIGNNFQYSDHSRLENILLTLHLLLWAVQQRSLPPPKKPTERKKNCHPVLSPQFQTSVPNKLIF